MTKPKFLMLEVTSHCNMHCTFCPSDDLVRKKGHVSDEHAIQLIRGARDLAPGIPIMFNVLGEPFLNKKLFDYIAVAEECGVQADLITNITLLTKERLEKLFRYSNVHLNMSLHTPTDKSFAERGYKKIGSFREYLEMVCNAVEAKFRARSKAGIEIYLASELIDNLMQNDAGSRLWTMYDDPAEYKAGWEICSERFTQLGAKIERDYPEAFAEGMARARRGHAAMIQSGDLVFRPEDIPEWRSESQPSGWMCAPEVIVRRKGFGMWAYHEKFVQRHAQPGRFVFHEERTEPFTCPGTYAFGILSDGTYSLCCQDVEGQMDIGNMATMDFHTAFHSPRREEIIANCATSRVCRRCAGNTMILDTQPIHDGKQAIDKFGFGWHVFEPHLFGTGARWTTGNAKAYFYTRIEADKLVMEFRSPFSPDIKFQILISAYDPTAKQFSLERTHTFHGGKNKMMLLTIPVMLRGNTFYRLSILSPTFSPKESPGSGDTRQFGLAVASISLSGRACQGQDAGDASFVLPGAPPLGANSQAYTFPILR